MIKTMGTLMPAWKKEEEEKRKEKRMNKIAHVFLQMFLSSKWEICFQGAK
jgi:hypothetical protein